MQFEKFDNKVREAAEHHHPAYNDKAWEKMEKLLDEHLPQKEKKRRRFFLLLFLFLLLGSGGWLLIGNPWQENNKLIKQKQSVESKISADDKSNRSNNKNDRTEKSLVPDKITRSKVEDKTKDVFENKTATIPSTKHTGKTPSVVFTESKFNSLSGNKPSKKTKKIVDNGKSNKAPMIVSLKSSDKDQVESNKTVVKNSTEIEKTEMHKPGNIIESGKKNPANQELALEKPDEPKKDDIKMEHPGKSLTEEKAINEVEENPDEKPGDVQLKQDLPAGKKSPGKKGKPGKKTIPIFLTASTGPDFSFVGSEGPGKVKWITGIGIGYTIKEKFTLRTGFYSARKIYSAMPGDYNAPDYFYNYYPNLQKIDADCKVYEIPLLLSYSFGKSINHNWFVSTGLSSYLMKKETYNYFYKYTPTSVTVSKKWTVPEKNKHFFSVINFSAGYQHRIGKSFSVTIEPYMKIPLSGVGFGKVKLNSGGILFSIGVNPFTHSSKK